MKHFTLNWDVTHEAQHLDKIIFGSFLTIVGRESSEDSLLWYDLPIRSIASLQKTLDEDASIFCKQILLFREFDKNSTDLFFRDLAYNVSLQAFPRKVFATYLQFKDNYCDPIFFHTHPQEDLLDTTVSFSWSLDDGSQNPKNWEFFDERLTAHLSWNYHGTLYSLKGHAYITSLSFLQKRVESHNPYYRRFINIVEFFDHSVVENWLYQIIEHAQNTHPIDRKEFLTQFLEYDDLPNFYER